MSEVETTRDGGVLTITLNRPDVLNAFNSPQFNPTFPGTADLGDPDEYRITGAGGAREIQLVWRINW